MTTDKGREMKTEDEVSGLKVFQAIVGCLAAMWAACVTGPMWLAILFGVLRCLGDDVPTWLWVCYWVYLPSYVFGILLATLFRGSERVK